MTRGGVLWRASQVLVTVAGVLLISFALIQIAPGDPVLALAGEHGDEAYYEDMRERFALDRPLSEQFLTFVFRMATGDLGTSWVQGRPAQSVIMERIPATLILTGAALLLSTILGGCLGVFGALRAETAADSMVTAGVLVMYSAPVFLVGQLALLLFALVFPIAPAFGMRSPGAELTGAAAALDLLRHLALPAAVLAAPQLAAVSRLTRSSLLTEMAAPYVRTARSKGLGTAGVVRHAMRLTLLPVITLVGSRAGQLFGGAVIVESIFGWPGIGTLLLDASRNRDVPVLLGIFLLVTFAVVTLNLLTDLTYSRLDPRVGERAQVTNTSESTGPKSVEEGAPA